jgi:DNA polymerase III subunit epsilon
MKPTRRIAIVAAVAFAFAVALVGAVLALLMAGLREEDARVMARVLEERGPLLAFVGLVGGIACISLARALHARWIAPLRTMAEQAILVGAAHPEQRISAEGPPEMAHLARAIDRLADAYRAERDTLQARLAEDRAGIEEERNRLAALMAELSEGVIVCNEQGRILLYNERARTLFMPEAQAPAQATSPVGLGRTVFGFLDPEQYAHAMDKIRYGLDRGTAAPMTLLFAPRPARGLIRVRIAPFLATGGRIAGHVLTCEDVTRALGQEDHRRALLQALATRVRAPAANVRAAAENLVAFPDMDEAQRARFTRIIATESHELSRTLDDALREYADALNAGVTLEEMRLADLVATAGRRLGAIPGLAVQAEAVDAASWVKVDSYAIAQALCAFAQRIRAELGVAEVSIRAGPQGNFAAVDVAWQGTKLAPEALAQWETQAVQVGAEHAALTIHQVLERHGGEAWHQHDEGSGESWLRFLVPLTQAPPAAPGRRAPGAGSRPEYYDFDLFRLADGARELLHQPLAALHYTVFDTETTGLQPSAGDRIISIGAVRIVNGRILRQEAFEQLVDPERTVPRDSIRIHGIQPAALSGQPTLREVLPAFHRFCEDSVLVAHNAAFDMRFLELAGPESGVSFAHPVLDTLLLSAAAHPHDQDHSLETIAARLGVAVVGRHTAVGDAFMTAEIFLRLVALLAAKGIHTLGEALAASRETYYVRLQY